MDSHEKIAKKIVDIFSDGRISHYDWRYIGLNAVTYGREDYLLDRMETFLYAVLDYRQQIQFGKAAEYEQDKLF